ncbi:MAG TPA: SMP-30/gluconolactonase/LRE family protein [Conexibacter sp.]|nr:SMP-30/gluconolactonase/LRE family protein [Conexibacter sp.]
MSGGTAVAVEAVDDHRSQLGENPHWDAATGVLQHVDIAVGVLHRVEVRTGRREQTPLGGEVGFAVPRRGGGLIYGRDRQIVLREVDGSERVVAEVEQGEADNRFNDGKADAAGRLWAGTMSKLRKPSMAALYRLDPDGEPTVALPGQTLANGLGWSPDRAAMYFIDSVAQRVDVLDFDLAAGALSGRRPLCTIDPADGLPDGLTVDAEGGVWVALFGGGCVRRYAPSGELEAEVSLPTTNPTSLAFGGEDMDELYVTTARHRLTLEQLAAEPLAGALLRLRPGVRGVAPNLYAG